MLKHIIFTEEPATAYSIAILIKEICLKYKEMQYNYVLPLSGKVPNENVIAFSLEYTDKNTSPAGLSRKYLIDTLLPAVAHLEIKTLFCCDASYFKYLTGAKKAETNLGYVLPCVIKGYEHLNIVLGINYSSMLYNDLNVPKLALALTTLVDHLEGTLVNLGADIIHSALYPTTLAQVKAMLAEKLSEPHITVDIEAFSLKFHKAGIGTICFCKDKHNGISFLVDYKPITPKLIDGKWHHGEQWDNREFKKELALFFIKYTGKVTYHNANYDVKILIYELFMDSLLDQVGMLNGLEIMTRGLRDTKVIKYLATNTTAGNKLGLKESIHEFTGDYAEEVNDIRLIPSKSLLKYNLIDGLGTHYLYEKCWDTVVKDDQLSIYTDIFIPSIKVILQMELTGMPVCMETILKTKAMMLAKQTKYKDIVQAHPIIIKFTELVKHKKMVKENAKLVKKQHDISHYVDLHFNPNSNSQMQHLLYEYLDYPVIDKTKSKAPAVGADTVRKFFVMDGIASTEEISLLKAILDYLDVSKILTTFIESFISNSILKEDGWHYLHGNFNLGGTVSGRLSSSQPNMQNIPSTGSTYAKDIKRCFKAPPGWLFVGADFASLEDRISALTTKDPQKLKIYIDGFDGHCLRAYHYFNRYYEGIEETPEAINATKKTHSKWRQDGKRSTFLLTYLGTYIGLMQKCGFNKEEALHIEANYHKLYVWSDKWVQAKIDQACIDGYVTCAFGLRLRTPLLARTILHTRQTPYKAKAEVRTAANALGQSYGLLNNRAAIEFQDITIKSEFALDVRPCSLIHDAIYAIVRNTPVALKFVNDNLTACMRWQELDAIKHDQVKLSGELDVFYPDWANAITLPNYINEEELVTICLKGASDYHKKSTP